MTSSTRRGRSGALGPASPLQRPPGDSTGPRGPRLWPLGGVAACAILSLFNVGMRRGPAVAGGEGDAFDGLVDSPRRGAPLASGNVAPGDGSALPAEPPSHLIYRHEARLGTSLRDSVGEPRHHLHAGRTGHPGPVQAGHPGTALGPDLRRMAMLGIFTLIFSRTQGTGVPPGIPYPIFAFIGILCWTFFAEALGDRWHRAADEPRSDEQDPVPAGVLSARDDSGERGEHRPGVDPAVLALRLLSLCPARPRRCGCPLLIVIEVALHRRAHARQCLP